ncbi:MAG TPA: caspase family protein [Blastocatellia bacterium]|nr:caspase family protein [Blastocatellia bacterium]
MPKRRLICSIVAIASAFLAVRMAQSQTSAQNTPGERTFAVVIGISKYPRLPGGYQLQFADRDATMFAETIKKAGASPDNVRLLTGPNATASNIRAAVGTWLARAASTSDTVYLFFSGHGLVESEFKESYLLAYDSDPKDPYATAVSIGEIGRALGRRLRARQVLILADAARRDFFNPDSDGASTTKLFTEAFAELATSRPGVSVMLASGPGEFSREGQRWSAGVFTKYAVEGLSGAGDADGDGSITGTEFFDFVSNHVAEDTSSKQHPWLAANSLAQITLPRSTARPSVIATAAGKSTPTQPEQRPTAKTSELERDRPEKAQPPVTLDHQKAPGPESTPGKTATHTDAPRVAAPPSGESNKSAGASVSSAQPNGETAKKSSPIGKDASSTRGPSTTVAGTAPAIRPPAETGPRGKTTSRGSKASGASARGSKPAISSRTSATTPGPKNEGSGPVTPSKPQEVNAAPPETTGSIGAGSKTESPPAPPKPVISPPSVPTLSAEPAKTGTRTVTGSIPVANAEPAPSPLILQIERAISSGALIEPRDASAWDYYQKLIKDPASASEASRLKPLLASALMKSGRTLVVGDVRADNITEEVDDFRRGGQMLARARALAPENAETAGFEKLSAAQALVGLQFYEEAEKALTQLQSLRLPAVENALGLAYMGSLNEWQAERAFKRAIDLNSNWAPPHYNLAMLYRSQKKEAIGELERAAVIDASNTSVLSALADEYFSKEKWAPAADTYRKAIAMKPNDETLHTKLGHALYSQGLRDEANREYQKAKEIRGRQ